MAQAKFLWWSSQGFSATHSDTVVGDPTTYIMETQVEGTLDECYEEFAAWRKEFGHKARKLEVMEDKMCVYHAKGELMEQGQWYNEELLLTIEVSDA
jgi:hypothetical protein